MQRLRIGVGFPGDNEDAGLDMPSYDAPGFRRKNVRSDTVKEVAPGERLVSRVRRSALTALKVILPVPGVYRMGSRP